MTDWDQEFTLRMASAVQLADNGAADAGLSMLLAGQASVLREMPAGNPIREKLISQYAELIQRYRHRFLESPADQRH